jgi:hypothetical protein
MSKYLKINETFNQHKLNYILQNKDILNVEDTFTKHDLNYFKMLYGKNYDPFTMCETYLYNSLDGVLTTNYRQNNGYGRYYAVNGMSQQGMLIKIRHTIAGEFYNDIDIVNAHPVILAHICDEKAIKCKYLKKYNTNRDKLLDGSITKQLIIAMINGGSSEYNKIELKPEWLVNLKLEISTIHDKLTKNADFKKFEKEKKKSGQDFNVKASFINRMICNFENDILQFMYKYFDSPKDVVLCFDGIQIRKDDPSLNWIVEDLAAVEEEILEKLDISLKLCIKPMDQGWTLPDDIPKYKGFEKFNYFSYINDEKKEKEYSYINFQNEFKNYVFDSYTELDRIISSKYPLVLARVLSGIGSYIKKNINGKIDNVVSLGSTGFDMFYFDESSKKRKIMLSEYLRTKNGFREVECKLENGSDECFNAWNGFGAVRIDLNSLTEKDKTSLQEMKDFLFKTWASSDDNLYRYIVSWFANCVRTGDINGTAMVLFSKQGAGKGFFIHFMSMLIRQCNTAVVTGISSMTQKHNTTIQNKRLICINELCSTREEFKSNFDKIKCFITDPTIQIEPKGVNPYEIDNIGNLVLCTNHRDSMVIEKGDRRYTILEVNECYLNNHAYFKDLADKCFNQTIINAFYTFLLDFDVVNTKVIINTPLRTEMMKLSMGSVDKYIEEIKNYPLMDFNRKIIKKIKAIDLYTKYVEWCSANGERNIISNTKFGLSVKLVYEKKRLTDGVYYTLSPE